MRVSSDKRKFDETEGNMDRETIKSHLGRASGAPRSSGVSDDFNLCDINSQDLLALDAETSLNSARAKRRTLDQKTIAERFDFGSQRPARSPPQQPLDPQTKIDTIFTTSKASLRGVKSVSKKPPPPHVAPEVQDPAAGTAWEGPFRKPSAPPNSSERPLPNSKSRPQDVHAQVTSYANSIRGVQRPPVPRQMDLLNGASARDSPATIVQSSQETSFSTVFDRDQSFTAPTPSTTASTSFSDCSSGPRNKATILKYPEPQIRAVALSAFENYRVRDLPTKGLFALDLPPNILSASPRVKYECSRLVHAWQISPDALSVLYGDRFEDYDTLWTQLKSLATNTARMPSKTSQPAWEQAKIGSANVCRSARLRYLPSTHSALFELEVAPLEEQRSCRFFRKFGAHRFLKLSLPSIATDTAPDHLRDQLPNLRRRLEDWLQAPDKAFMGYRWSVLCVKPCKSRKTSIKVADVSDDQRGYDVFLFATGGEGLEPISMTQVLEWYMPLRSNLSMSVCKAFARIELGLSKTLPTLVFSPEQVREVGDITSDGTREADTHNDRNLDWPGLSGKTSDTVMNDGCSRMSLAAAQQIWILLRESGPCPSAFQARIGPWKGIWTVSHLPKLGEEEVWIEVTPSQRKFVRHVEDLHHSTYDPGRLTFEVLDWSYMPKESHLHIDYLPLLEDRGVPRTALKDLVQEMLDQYKGSFEVALSSPQTLYRWVEDKFGGEAGNDDTTDQTWQRVKLLLDSGFEFEQFLHLQKRVKSLARSWFKLHSANLRLPVARSTYLWGVADPLGVLAPGEVHLQVSSSFGETSSTYLHDVELLVGRHPAIRRSDVQKVKAVFKLELGHLKDIVVFPSKGQIPLAGKLQGGDYDGDKFWVCWEPSIVQPFRNAPCPTSTCKPEELGIEVEKRTIADVVAWKDPQPVAEFFKVALQFAMQQPLLGVATNYHRNLCYGQNTITSFSIDRLADLHDLLVDTAKNGYQFGMKQWQGFQANLAGVRPFDTKVPMYKGISKNTLFERASKAADSSVPHGHIVDYLMFDVAAPHAAGIVKDIEGMHFGATSIDNAVSNLYRSVISLGSRTANAAVIEMTVAIEELFKRHCRAYGGIISRVNASFGSSSFSENAAYRDIDRKTRTDYHASQPSEAIRCILEKRGWFGKVADPRPSYWELVKASALFTIISTKPNTSADDFIFTCDAYNVCYLKAHSSMEGHGRPRTVIPNIYRDLRMRKVKISLAFEQSHKLSSFDVSNRSFADPAIEDDGNDTEPDDEGMQFHEAPEHLAQGMGDVTLESPMKRHGLEPQRAPYY